MDWILLFDSLLLDFVVGLLIFAVLFSAKTLWTMHRELERMVEYVQDLREEVIRLNQKIDDLNETLYRK